MKKLLLILVVYLCFGLNLSAETNIIRLADIKPGMTGIGRTVFSGDEIESFECEVIDIVKNLAPQLDVIMVRLIGPRLKETGVISGMSGSPIYIDGKLAGALAYSFGDFMKDPIAGITPIEQMLEIDKKEQNRQKELSAVHSASIPSSALTGYDDPERLFKELNLHHIRNTTDFKPISLPLTFSGFNSTVIADIQPLLESMGFSVSSGGSNSAASTATGPVIRPGDAISGVLISGDLGISATGTVTLCEGDKIYAFGHPFFNSGPVSIPMAKAKILTVLSSMRHSRKFASMGDIIGSIQQDRSSGILGYIGRPAPVFPVEIVYQSPFDAPKTYRYQVAEDPSLRTMTPIFFWLTLLSSLESARFSTGDYSMKLNGKFMLNGDSDIILDNFYTTGQFSEPSGEGRDIMAAAFDVVMTLVPLMVNDFKYPDIRKIELTFQATPGKRSYQIDKIRYDKSEIVPGEDVHLSIRMRGYQGETMTVEKTISIPKNLSAPRVIISIGSADYITNLERSTTPAKFQPQDFNGLIEILNQRRKNDHLYLQLKIMGKGAFIEGEELADLPPTILNILETPKTRGGNTKMNQTVIQEYHQPMDAEVYGGNSIMLKVKKHKTF